MSYNIFFVYGKMSDILSISIFAQHSPKQFPRCSTTGVVSLNKSFFTNENLQIK